jgi:hypothetical protein
MTAGEVHPTQGDANPRSPSFQGEVKKEVILLPAVFKN